MPARATAIAGSARIASGLDIVPAVFAGTLVHVIGLKRASLSTWTTLPAPRALVREVGGA